MERKLRKCRVCGEWFNTTEGIMLRHYIGHHPGESIRFFRASTSALTLALARACTAAGTFARAMALADLERQLGADE